MEINDKAQTLQNYKNQKKYTEAILFLNKKLPRKFYNSTIRIKIMLYAYYSIVYEKQSKRKLV